VRRAIDSFRHLQRAESSVHIAAESDGVTSAGDLADSQHMIAPFRDRCAAFAGSATDQERAEDIDSDDAATPRDFTNLFVA